MKVAVIGCGYVFDHYMATWSNHPVLEIAGVTDVNRGRADAVAQAYGLAVYDSNTDALADPDVQIVVNLTSIGSHYEVTKAALEAGKHVYSEKPLVTTLDQARELIALAEERELRLSCAPSNALSDTVQTMWKAVRDGAVGDVRIVYAEFDDNPIYLMSPEDWRSRTGAPWPYLHEYEMGCTWEHVGYHLTWLCAMFGPVASVTAFSKQVLPDKTDEALDPSDTPDFSVACLNFHSGVVARVTCSIGAPYDHRMRIIGNRGMLSADTYRNYRCPVYLERFTKISLNSRKSLSVRRSTALQWLFGVGGARVKLFDLPPPEGPRRARARFSSWHPRELLRRVRRYELGQQDKSLGIAELAVAIESGRASFPPHDFTLHLTELTLLIQSAGTESGALALTTTCEPVEPRQTSDHTVELRERVATRLLSKFAEPYLDKMHRH